MAGEQFLDQRLVERLGRGDGSIDEWKDLRREGIEESEGGTAEYLLGEPMLSDFLADGLDEFGLSWSKERTTPIQ